MLPAILHSSLALTLAVCATFVPRLRRPHTPNPDHEPIHRPFRSHRCPTRPRRAAQRRRHAHPRRRLLRPPAERPGADRKSTRLNSSHTVIYTLSLHDALPIFPQPPLPDPPPPRRTAAPSCTSSAPSSSSTC